MSTTKTDWNISTDIYDIVGSIDELKKRYVEDEDETTLALGIFGFIGDTEAKKIQTSIIMASELGNEMFPQRAKFDKNIVTHAMYCNVDNLNATPAKMTINMAILESDLNTYMKDNKFVFDHNCPIYIGDYEFHFDYDIILSRKMNYSTKNYIYSARYDMTDENSISDITNPYLKQPYYTNFNNEIYIFFQASVRQVTIETTIDKMITASVIDNKSFTFTFENQLADFDVFITENGKTTRLQPIVYGSPIESGVTDYCWYLYMNEYSIRIGFDSKSYLPGLNAEVKIVAKTTLGEAGNFSYKKDLEDSGFFVDYESSLYNNKKIKCYVICATDSVNGKDKKTIEELKNLIPKMAMSRGYITTETDLNNYFNLISTDSNRLKLQKKIDNQLNRIWYCYLLMKDEYNNIIPTNTIPIKIDLKSEYVSECINEEGRYIIPAGTLFKYNSDTGFGICIKEEDVPEIFSDEYFADNKTYYYRLIYNLVVDTNPLYCAYYLTLVNTDGYFEYNYINPEMFMGFIANTNHFERSLLTNRNEYRLTFSITQSINEDFGLYNIIKDTSTGTEIVENNMKVFLVLYSEGTPYRYIEADLTNFNASEYVSDWNISLLTDDDFDSKNRIKLINLKEIGFYTDNYGFFEENTEAYIYIFGKFSEEYGRYTADKLIPGLEGYSIINIYKIANGLSLFNNFSSVMNTRIRANKSEDLTQITYDISGVPMIGEHYFTSEDNVTYFLNELEEKKAYIDYCLTVLENNMDIDFKYFNTYGYSKTYTIGDKEGSSLGNIDITMKFRAKLSSQSDYTTKDALVKYIKEYIEDLNDIGDLHISSLIHDIHDYFGDLIVYVEFMNFNENRLGINHIELKEVESIHTVPEFISVRNKWNEDKTALTPCIDMEIVSY